MAEKLDFKDLGDINVTVEIIPTDGNENELSAANFSIKKVERAGKEENERFTQDSLIKFFSQFEKIQGGGTKKRRRRKKGKKRKTASRK